MVPSPDAMRLAVPKAFCVLRGDATPSREVALEIFRFVRERLPALQARSAIEFCELPKTISGKIRRVELRALEQRRHAASERGGDGVSGGGFPGAARREVRLGRPASANLIAATNDSRQDGQDGRSCLLCFRSFR